MLAAAIEVAQAVVVGHWAGFFQHLLAAILFGVAGFVMVTRPLITAEVLTLFMAMFFLIGGLFQLIGSAWVGLTGWGWHAADGIITFVLGLLVLAQWPASGLWVIGLFLGIDLIFYESPGSRSRSACGQCELDRGLLAVLRRVRETARESRAFQPEPFIP